MMIGRARHLIWVAVGAVALAAIPVGLGLAETADPACASPVSMPVLFLGNAAGHGTIALAPAGDGMVRAEVRIDPPSEGQAGLAFSGTGVCVDGRFVVPLGAPTTADASITLAGVELSGVLAVDGRFARAFGTWDALTKRGEEDHLIRGLWRALDDEEGAR